MAGLCASPLSAGVRFWWVFRCPSAALVFAHASPYAVVLAGVQRERPGKAAGLGLPAQIAVAWVT